MRFLLLLLYLVLLLNTSLGTDNFEDEEVKLGKRKCICSFSFLPEGSSCNGKAKCDKKCTGVGSVAIGQYTLTLRVKRGRATVSKCQFKEVSKPGHISKCVKGFTQVCPLIGEVCPKEMDMVCPRDPQNRMLNGNSQIMEPGCTCIPDFLISLVTPEMLPSLSRMVKVSTEAMETIKVGKRKCKCKFNMEVDGSSCLKSQGTCDKKCNGQAKQVKIMKGMYLLDISVKKGKVMINKCEVTEPELNEIGSAEINNEGSELSCNCIEKGKLFPTEQGSGVGSVSEVTIVEGGETFVQENKFSNSTGILEIKVPSHKNYTESIFILHQESKSSLLKTNNTCQVSNLPVYINVSEMVQQMEHLDEENTTISEINTINTFVVKSRQSRYGQSRRKELLNEIQDHCKNEPVIETNDFIVNETEFQKLAAGEIVLIEKKKATRLCAIHHQCTTGGPRACGYGWVNPAGGGISAHELSQTSVCVDCVIEEFGAPTCSQQYPGICNCTDIISKQTLMDCVINRSTKIKIEENGDVFSQSLSYNNKNIKRSVSITSPAHNDLQTLDIVMHAHSNGYWHHYAKNNHMVKLANVCHVQTLPTNVFPVDIAIGIQEIKNGNNVTRKEDEIETQGIILTTGSITEQDKNALHEDIKHLCSNSRVETYVEMPINKTESDDLRSGKVIVLPSKPTRNNCVVQSAVTSNNNGSGCWRWPNPETGENVLLHHIVTSVIEVTCCSNRPGFDTCCEDIYPQYCECEDITRETFDQCRPPLATPILVGDLMDNGTTITVSQNFTYDRENGGSLRIDVEAHKDYEKSTMILNDTTVVLKRGNAPCSVLNSFPSASSPEQTALDAAQVKATYTGNISPEDQKRQDYVLVTSDKIPNVSGNLNVCTNYTAASLVPISSQQLQSLQSGEVISIREESLARESNISPCLIQEACATNNGSSCFRFPTLQGENIWVHDVVSSPVCLNCCIDGYDPNLCACSDIVDKESFEFCLGPKPEAILVAGGSGLDDTILSSVEILTRQIGGNYSSREVGVCSKVPNFPVETSSPTGALFDKLPHICVGYKKEDQSNQCYKLSMDGVWQQSFSLNKPLKWWGSSVTLNSWNGRNVSNLWWLVGGDPDGTSTELWVGNEPYHELGNDDIKLPEQINKPCMTRISETEVFVSAVPKYGSENLNSAWIYQTNRNTRKNLSKTQEKHSGGSCGLIKSPNGSFVVVAGGYKSSTTELLNLETLTWSMGPRLNTAVYGGNMVSVMDNEELLLIGGYNTDAMFQVQKLTSNLTSWEPAGNMKVPRFNVAAIAVPIENLPTVTRC